MSINIQHIPVDESLKTSGKLVQKRNKIQTRIFVVIAVLCSLLEYARHKSGKMKNSAGKCITSEKKKKINKKLRQKQKKNEAGCIVQKYEPNVKWCRNISHYLCTIFYLNYFPMFFKNSLFPINKTGGKKTFYFQRSVLSSFRNCECLFLEWPGLWLQMMINILMVNFGGKAISIDIRSLIKRWNNLWRKCE